ncbi:HPr(Ser) kinase/phosphatase [Guyparkeria hydrothermalis]|uniref:HPr(Ser) kinase/phosphatase n=1 Tax=Guyparkeria hydrothermalis TaxID=923 RepID=UPI0024C3CAC6|nr:HPr(Ser) kinase/phosphatase [Guyparkeria hydrothermalis]
MIPSFTHHHLSSDASDADWQWALPDQWQAGVAPDQRRIGPANPWIPTRLALISPALRRYLQCGEECLIHANGPLPANDGPRTIVLTEAHAGAVDEWLAHVPVAEPGHGTPIVVISTPDDDESVSQRLQRLCGAHDEDWRHGVFMEISGLGVLIRGTAGIGKSEVALELISRGHRLIADDAPCFIARGDEVTGSCPDRLFGLLEVRGIGILDIRELFGSNALKARKYLRLIVDLYPADSEHHMGADERLFGDRGNERIAGLSIPVWRMPVAPGRNLAVLLEAIVRQRNLERQRGGQPVSPRVGRLLADGEIPDNPDQKPEPWS